MAYSIVELEGRDGRIKVKTSYIKKYVDLYCSTYYLVKNKNIDDIKELEKQKNTILNNNKNKNKNISLSSKELEKQMKLKVEVLPNHILPAEKVIFSQDSNCFHNLNDMETKLGYINEDNMEIGFDWIEVINEDVE